MIKKKSVLECLVALGSGQAYRHQICKTSGKVRYMIFAER